MEKCLVLVDRDFFKLVKKEFEIKGGKRKKFFQTFRNICRKENLNLEHLFIYMAPPFQSRVSNKEESIRRRKYDNIKKMMDKKKWVTVREGRCQKIFNDKGDAVFNQKGVDSWIVADLCLFDKSFPDIIKIILITSDSDFAPVIEMVRESKGVEIIIYTYFEKSRKSRFRRSNHLLKVCSKWVKLNEENFENVF